MRRNTPLKKHIRESPEVLRLRHKRKMVRIRWVAFFAALLAVLLSLFVYVSRHPKFLITEIVVSGNQVIDERDITALIEEQLAGNYVYVIPHRNAYLYPKARIIRDLREQFPRLDEIHISRSGFGLLTIAVTEVRVISLWCGQDVSVIDASVPCYFTDSTGKIVSEAPYYSGNVYIRFFGSTLFTKDAEVLGNNFVEKKDFAELFAFAERVRHLDLPVKAVRIGPGNENAIILDIGEEKNAPIRFLAKDDLRVLVANLSAALEKEELKTALLNKLSNLEYFDLRFQNKVYYKFREHP